jgi:hypothetical protein
VSTEQSLMGRNSLCTSRATALQSSPISKVRQYNHNFVLLTPPLGKGRPYVIDFSVLHLVPQLNILLLLGAPVLPTFSSGIDIFRGHAVA